MAPPPTDKLEAHTRKEIDQKLIAAGWSIQDKKRINLHASLGVAVREMDTSTGPADYMLFVDGKACGVIEAKREGANLGHVAEQSARSATKTTAGQSGVAGGDVKKCPVILPSCFEQRKIAEIVDEKIDAIEHLEREVNKQFLKAGKNKQSILASAFSGRLING